MSRPPAEHGTRSRYNGGCRCEPCRTANRVYVSQLRRAAGVKPLPAPSAHGTANRYRKYRCRCDQCRTAEAARRRANRHRARGLAS